MEIKTVKSNDSNKWSAPKWAFVLVAISLLYLICYHIVSGEGSHSNSYMTYIVPAIPLSFILIASKLFHYWKSLSATTFAKQMLLTIILLFLGQNTTWVNQLQIDAFAWAGYNNVIYSVIIATAYTFAATLLRFIFSEKDNLDEVLIYSVPISMLVFIVGIIS